MKRMERKEWCVGFIMNQSGTQVLLLLGSKQKKMFGGMLNGIGGRLEHGETPLDAMKREGSEETGGFIEPNMKAQWHPFAQYALLDKDQKPGLLHCFYIAISAAQLSALNRHSFEEGTLYAVNINDIHLGGGEVTIHTSSDAMKVCPVVSNVPYLLALALCEHNGSTITWEKGVTMPPPRWLAGRLFSQPPEVPNWKKLNLTIRRVKGSGFKVYDQADGREIQNVVQLDDDGTVLDIVCHRHHAIVTLSLLIMGDAMDNLYVDIPEGDEVPTQPEPQPDVDDRGRIIDAQKYIARCLQAAEASRDTAEQQQEYATADHYSGQVIAYQEAGRALKEAYGLPEADTHDPIAEEVGRRVLVLFGAVKDHVPWFLNEEDFHMVAGIYEALGENVPSEITAYLEGVRPGENGGT